MHYKMSKSGMLASRGKKHVKALKSQLCPSGY